MTAKDNGKLTIDELAQKTRMTVRNIRAHQSRGLLPPPEVVGRTGYYGEEHLARIELIKELQGEGYNLELIGRLLENAGGSSDEVLRFTRAVREPFVAEEPQIIEAAELAQLMGSTDPALIAKGEKLGLIRPIDDTTFEVTSPRLLKAGSELVALGTSAEQVLEIAARLRRHADSVASIYVRVFLDNVWTPFEKAGPARGRLAGGARDDRAAAPARCRVAAGRLPARHGRRRRERRRARARA